MKFHFASPFCLPNKKKEPSNVLFSQASCQLSSALESLTSVFGMLDRYFLSALATRSLFLFDLSKPETRLLPLSTTPWSWQVMGSDQVLGRLVPVNSTHRCASIPGLSTSSSLRGLTSSQNGRSHLGVGFVLRCFQRLSLPCFATRLYHWRDNRSTSGRSIPVLSY